MPKKRQSKEEETTTQTCGGGDDLQSILEAVGERGEELLGVLAEEIKKRPIRSVAIAAGVGFILAKLFGGRRRS